MTQFSRKKPAKRLFRGLAGSPLSRANGKNRKRLPQEPSPALSELLAKQTQAEEVRRQQEYFYAILKQEGFEVGDDQPILTSTRGRHRNSGGPKFQRYQFRLRTTGDRNSRFDRGLSPHVYDSMSANREIRNSELDSEGADTAHLFREAGKLEADFDPNSKARTSSEVSIANVAQSLPRGFSTGVLNPKFDFIDTPREPRPETAWLFDDLKLWTFLARLTPDEALDRFEAEPDDWAAREFLIPALKAFACLYNHFRIGKTDKNFLSDNDLRNLQFWPSRNALKRYRSRLLMKGLELFGSSEAPKEFTVADPHRIQKVRSAVTRLYRQLAVESADYEATI